jgi:hypothetical protein
MWTGTDFIYTDTLKEVTIVLHSDADECQCISICHPVTAMM